MTTLSSRLRKSVACLIPVSLLWVAAANAQQPYQAVVGAGVQTSLDCQIGSGCGITSGCGTTSVYYGPITLLSSLPLVKQGDKWIPAQVSTTQVTSAGGGTANFESTLTADGKVKTTETAGFWSYGDIATGLVTFSNIQSQETLDLNTGRYTWHRSGPTTVAVAGSCTEQFDQSQDRTADLPVNLYPTSYVLKASVSFTNPALAATGNPLPLASSIDSSIVANSPAASGLAADGSSAIAVVVHSNSSASPNLSLKGSGTVSGPIAGLPIGSLTPFSSDYLINPQPGSQTSLTGLTPVDSSTCNADTDKAGTSSCIFLGLLWAPTAMPYSASDLQTLTAEDVTLTVTGTQPNTDGSPLTYAKSATLQPPPLVLVHGVWSSPAQAWGDLAQGTPTFFPWLTRNYPYAGVFMVDYGSTSYLSFKNVVNQQALTQTIATAISTYAAQGIAAQKVDVVAHSMGGLLTRFVEENGAPVSFYLPSNFVHSLITFGTPHTGTKMATTLWTYKDANIAVTHRNPIYLAICAPTTTCTLEQILASMDKRVDSAVEDMQTSLGPPTTESYKSISGDAPIVSILGLAFNALLAAYVPGTHTVSTVLGTTNNDALVPGTSQLAYAGDSATIDGIVHTNIGGDIGETASPEVWNQVLYWLLGGTGTVPPTTIQHVVKSSVRPSDTTVSSGPSPVMDLTGYPQVSATNVTFLPASGTTLSIGSPATITATSGKTITEVLLYQTVSDPTDTWFSYSTESPFSITYTPSRIGGANFTAFAVFSDNTYATTTLQYTLEPTGTSFGLQLTNLPAGSMAVGLPAIVGVQAGYQTGYVDVSSLAAYSTGSGGSSVFSVAAGGNITPIGPGVDVLNVSYNGMAISAPISVGSCAFALGPLNQLVSFGGGTVTIGVTTNPGCSWTAQVDQTWLSLSGGSGTGSGTITGVAQANASGSNQTAFVTLAGQDVAIVQPAGACTYVVSPTSLSLPASGGSGTLGVTTACPTTSSSDAAWANVTTLAPGSVAYNVDANTSLTSRSATLTVGTQDVSLIEAAANSTPTVMVTPSASSITTAQALMVTVVVSGGTGNPTPTGSVTLSSGSYTSAAGTLSSGSATISVPAGSLATGTDTLTASYTPDFNSSSTYNSASGTASVTITVPAKTTPTVTVTPASSTITTAQALSVIVGVNGTPTPTGTVTLGSGSYTSGAATLSGGSASINIPAGSLATGNDALTAIYTPDSSSSSAYNSASGTSASVTVTQAKTTPTVTVTPSSSSITTAQALSVIVAVSGTPTPTGSVTLASGSYTSAAATLGSGSASINIPAGSLNTGSDTLTASYSGDSNYNLTTGTAPVTVTTAVNPGVTISGTAVSITPGAATGNTSTITVTPAGGFTGSVVLTAAVTSSPTGAQYPPTLSFGSTSPLSISGTNAGTATLTVSTTAATSATLIYPKRPGFPWYPAGGATLACILLFGIPSRRSRWLTMLGMLMFLVALTGGVSACGGGGSGGGGGGTSNPGTTAGVYTVTVTGTSGTTTATGAVTLTVQ